MPCALVFGGNGALGRAYVAAFKEAGYTVYAVDLSEKVDGADVSVQIGGAEPEADAAKVKAALVDAKATIDVALCAAGGWAGGSVASDDVFKSVDRMWRFNVQSALACAHVACKTLADNGLLVLTGAHAALGACEGMVGYGVSKVATHHIVACLAQPSGGLPAAASVCAVLPVTLDTPSNRTAMPDANHDEWTPTAAVAAEVLAWAKGERRPANGALVSVKTSKADGTVFVKN